MIEIPVEDMLKQTGSVFKLVNLAAKRTVQISEGAPPLIEASKLAKPAAIALAEIADGKVKFKLTK